jgi:hypothetical protein
LPAGADQAAALTTIKDLFKDEYKLVAAAKPNPADLLKLSARLLEQANDPKVDPVTRYVLLTEGRELAARAGNGPVACAAIDDLAADYDVDACRLKAAALGRAGQAVKADDVRELAELCLSVLDEGIAADNYTACTEVIKVAEAAVRLAKDVPLNQLVAERKKELDNIKKESEAAKAVAEVLKDKPDDPDANLKLGKFLCLIKGDWERGLPLLVKGSDAGLRDLALRDLNRPATPLGLKDVADAWLKLALAERGAGRT